MISVDNKLLITLSEISTQHASTTEATSTAINQLLDYVATYPNDGITYRDSNMRLSAHSDVAHLNLSKENTHAGAHIFLYKEEHKPRYNRSILTIFQIIKFFISSAAEAGLAAILSPSRTWYPCAKFS